MRDRHRIVTLALAALTGSAAATPLAAQVAEGLSLGLTPTVERTFFNDDLFFEDATYFGGRASLNFGRHIGLEGYYLTVDALGGEGIGAYESERFGGDVIFTILERKFSPFVRLGAGILNLEDAAAAQSEHLTATLGAGVRFDLFSRLQTQLFVQDVAFRSSPSLAFIDPASVSDPTETKTLHNLTVGAGVNFYVGGRPRQTETDLAFEGMGGISFPLELFAGEIRFDDAFGLPDETIAGARLGIDFGPYVGLRGYYYGSVEDDFKAFDDFYSYGAEGVFNLTRSDSPLTPFLVLGSGRMHFSDAQQTLAGFTEDRKWTATLGGGLAVNLNERLRLEAAVRDVLISRDDPNNVSAPDQLESNWMLTGGLKFALGGRTGPRPSPLPERGPTFTEGEQAGTPAPAAEAQQPTPAQQPVVGAAVAPTTAEAQTIQELRMRVEQLERELMAQRGGAAAPAPVEPTTALAAAPTAGADSARAAATGQPGAVTGQTIQLPVLERGEIYIRYGEPGVFDRFAENRVLVVPAGQAQPGQPAGQVAPGVSAAPAPAAGVQPAAAAVAQPSATALQLEAAREAEYLRLVSMLERVSARLDSLETASTRQRTVEDERMLGEIDARLNEIRTRQQQLQTGVVVPSSQPTTIRVERDEPQVVVRVEDSGPGIFRGGGIRVDQVGVYTGASLVDPEQALLGVRVDIGSAFGGAARLVPEVTYGFTGDNTLNINAHIEWPLPVSFSGIKPFVGTGLGILSGRDDPTTPKNDGDTELLIPNMVVGASYPVSGVEVFGAFQGLDLFDDNRVIFGVRTRPRGRSARVAQQAVSMATPAPAAAPELPVEGLQPEALDPAVIAEQERLAAERALLEAELAEIEGRLSEQREAAERARAEEARRREEAARAAALDEAHRRLLVRFRSMAVELGSVSEVRQGDRGLTVVLGGTDVFRTGQSTLSPQAQQEIRQLASALVEYPDFAVAVEGHTDSTGGDALNQRLSEARAQTVRQALIANGVQASRITAAGLGEARPIATNDTAVGRSRNRRVEVIVLELYPRNG